MNVTEFAEQIVFGKTLEDKLLVPGRLTHDGKAKNRPRVEAVHTPGRIAELQMKHEKGGNVKSPADDRLENEFERGKLLHFLANHELLATELMALVLLKFPDAPHAFRQGILVTLQEEQEHTRMYIKRMKECGVELGDFPLSGYFWRVIEPMKSPMDFVSRLSLTFEQANLDYSLHFAKVFKQIGDDETSGLLQQIYEDEIGHVQHGLHWFRQWKDPEQSDWEAYQASLVFPMSPQRGRGPRAAFNRDGRVQAGLTREFIDSIEVYRQSRGRPPSIRWFDPGAEAELDCVNGTVKSKRMLEQLGNDLELTIVPMARQDDTILVRKMPSKELRRHWADVGLDLPEFCLFDNRKRLADRMLEDFQPWAWTPENHKVIEPLMGSVRNAPAAWDEANRQLFRKSWSSRKLASWLDDDETPVWMVEKDSVVAITVNSVADVSEAMETFASRGIESLIFKQDLAASGRGQRRFYSKNGLTKEDILWLNSIFGLYPFEAADKDDLSIALLEPELDRLLDLSFLWQVSEAGGEAKFLGWTRPIVKPGRRYAGTRVGVPFNDCDPEIKRFLLPDRCARLQDIADWLTKTVVVELAKRNFVGYFGIDALVCRDRNGSLKIKPIVELNPRMTMGHVAKRLEKRIASGVSAEFRILSRKEWAQERGRLDSIPFAYSGDQRWKTGLIKFCDVGETTKLIPILEVGH